MFGQDKLNENEARKGLIFLSFFTAKLTEDTQRLQLRVFLLIQKLELIA
ncbi:hypothetical protein LV85_02700 [Algoriphagus chordae]|uniref:Uncharacterized protein n=1 Tax=Algoriphagus chordae TaxID=237019 RepID=A0A2W7QQ16_9BACT|nr:hypothetical protein LV85_02700 [Algoriphagus chordae]